MCSHIRYTVSFRFRVNMVKFENDRIAFTASNTRITKLKLIYQLSSIFFKSSCIVSGPSFVACLIRFIMRSRIFSCAYFTLTRFNFFCFTPPTERADTFCFFTGTTLLFHYLLPFPKAGSSIQ